MLILKLDIAAGIEIMGKLIEHSRIGIIARRETAIGRRIFYALNHPVEAMLAAQVLEENKKLPSRPSRLTILLNRNRETYG